LSKDGKARQVKSRRLRPSEARGIRHLYVDENKKRRALWGALLEYKVG